MTRRARKVCSTPGCPILAPSGASKCDEHTRDADRARGSASDRGYDALWRETRRRFLEQDPFCSEPGCARLATDVDHIHGDGPLAPEGHSFERLQGLCHSHHSAKTARENGSFGRWAS